MHIFNLVAAISVTATVAQAQQQYTVQPGDSLRQIAIRELGDLRSWRDLCELNNLADCNRILTGQVLQLSAQQQDVSETEEAAAEATESSGSASPTSSVRNMVPNSRMIGAAAGILGKGGVLPKGWGIGGLQGAEVVQTGIEEGLPFIDLRLAGAPIGSAIFVNFLKSENSVEVARGQTWTSSAFVRRVGGSLQNVDYVFLRVQEFSGKGGSGTNITADLDTCTRAAVTREISDAAADRMISFFRIGAS